MDFKELPLARTKGDENTPVVGQLAHTHTCAYKRWTVTEMEQHGLQCAGARGSSKGHSNCGIQSQIGDRDLKAKPNIQAR